MTLEPGTLAKRLELGRGLDTEEEAGRAGHAGHKIAGKTGTIASLLFKDIYSYELAVGIRAR